MSKGKHRNDGTSRSAVAVHAAVCDESGNGCVDDCVETVAVVEPEFSQDESNKSAQNDGRR